MVGFHFFPVLKKEVKLHRMNCGFSLNSFPLSRTNSSLPDGEDPPTHTHTSQPQPPTPPLCPHSLAPDWLFTSSKDPTITRPCRTLAPHEKQLMCCRGSIHLSSLPIRRRSAPALLFQFLPFFFHPQLTLQLARSRSSQK